MGHEGPAPPQPTGSPLIGRQPPRHTKVLRQRQITVSKLLITSLGSKVISNVLPVKDEGDKREVNNRLCKGFCLKGNRRQTEAVPHQVSVPRPTYQPKGGVKGQKFYYST